jgi:hypothetical protein
MASFRPWRSSSQGASFPSSDPATRSDGVLEYCAKSELHPPSGLEMLKEEMEQSLLCVSLIPSYVFEGK